MTRAAVWLLLCVCACGGAAGSPEQALQPDAAVATRPDATALQPGCVAPEGMTAAPETIDDVVALLNALPKPVSLACVLEALPHPFAIHAAQSILSAQPAVGRRSPRIFIFFEPLMLSVVPAGEGQHLLEFGERRSETHTLKAELEFPIETQLDRFSPYTRLRFDERFSTCSFCHGDEVPAADIVHPYARISKAIRPMASQRVTVAELRAELASCDASREPFRCAMLDAIFGPAETALEAEFPPEWTTFF